MKKVIKSVLLIFLIFVTLISIFIAVRRSQIELEIRFSTSDTRGTEYVITFFRSGRVTYYKGPLGLVNYFTGVSNKPLIIENEKRNEIISLAKKMVQSGQRTGTQIHAQCTIIYLFFDKDYYVDIYNFDMNTYFKTLIDNVVEIVPDKIPLSQL